MHQIPLVVLCGFLGSGKTTLLRRWRRDAALRDAAVIVHDLSEFGLDAELLFGDAKTPSSGHIEGRIAALHGSHARDQLRASVGTALNEIASLEPSPPLVLCESTGAARPWPLIKALTQDDRFFLRHFIVTVDALNLHRDFADGRVLTGEVSAPDDAALHGAAEILSEQIAFASVVVLTKTDTVPKSVIDTQIKTLQQLQPTAAIGLSAQAGLLLSHLDSSPPPKLPILTARAEQFGLAEDDSITDELEALVFRDPRPFHPARLHDACQSKLGTGLYRTKGFLWLASRPSDVLLWQQSGSQIALELTGFWHAHVVASPDTKLLPEEIEQLKTQLESAHPVFGDRHNEITLIGLRQDREAFFASLRQALCTDSEIAAWQNGETFPDPWPKSIRRTE